MSPRARAGRDWPRPPQPLPPHCPTSAPPGLPAPPLFPFSCPQAALDLSPQLGPPEPSRPLSPRHHPEAVSPLASDRPASSLRRSSPFSLGMLSSRASAFPRPPPLRPFRLPWRFPCLCQAGAGTGRLTNWDGVNWLPGKLGGGVQNCSTCGQGQVSACFCARGVPSL